LTSGPQQLVPNQAHVPELASVTPHTSSWHSFSKGVCANAQSLGDAAVVNDIYVPPPRAPSSAVSRPVSAI